MRDNESVQYRAWGNDDIAYGPVELQEMVQWIQEGRLPPDPWIFRSDTREGGASIGNCNEAIHVITTPGVPRNRVVRNPTGKEFHHEC